MLRIAMVGMVTVLVLAAWARPSAARDPKGKLGLPIDVATDSAGYVYVVDFHSARIQKFTASGTFVAAWGRHGAGDGQFNTGPWGIGTGPHSVYVADGSRYEFNGVYRNNRIQKFTRRGTFVSKWGSFGSGPGQFSLVNDVATDSVGNVYVVDTDNGRIQKFTPDGVFIAEFGNTGVFGQGRLWGPRRIAVDPDGYVYVTDQGTASIQKFTSDGIFVARWNLYGPGDPPSAPWGIATDSAGHVYVTDINADIVQKFTSDGAIISQWGSEGVGRGQFNDPEGIATDLAGNVYVADAYNNRIEKFTSDGAFVTAWGNRRPGRSRHGHLVIRTAGGNAHVPRPCRRKRACRGRVTIVSAGEILARGHYSIPANSSREVAIPLTKAGRRALASGRPVTGRLIVVEAGTNRRSTWTVTLR